MHCSRIEASWPRPISWGNLLMSTESERFKIRSFPKPCRISLYPTSLPDAHESCRKTPSQPHACSRFIVYSKECRKVQAPIQIFAGKFMEMVPGSASVCSAVAQVCSALQSQRSSRGVPGPVSLRESSLQTRESLSLRRFCLAWSRPAREEIGHAPSLGHLHPRFAL